MASIQRYVGGATGIGSTVGARRFLDESGQSRFQQPSVLIGGLTGLAAGALYVTDAVEVPVVSDDLLASHAITATPLAGFYAAFPKRSGQSTTEQVREAVLGGSGTNRRSSGGSGGGSNGDSATAGSTEVMTSGYGRRRRTGA